MNARFERMDVRLDTMDTRLGSLGDSFASLDEWTRHLVTDHESRLRVLK